MARRLTLTPPLYQGDLQGHHLVMVGSYGQKTFSEETYSVGEWRLYRSSSRITSRLRNVRGSSESSARSAANSDVSGRLEFSIPVS